MSTAISYIFSVWAGLIAANIAFGAAVRRWAEHWTAGGGYDGDADRDRTSDRGRDLSEAAGD